MTAPICIHCGKTVTKSRNQFYPWRHENGWLICDHDAAEATFADPGFPEPEDVA